MTADLILEKGRHAIEVEADAVRNLLGKIDRQFVKAVEVIYESKGRVVLTGVGKSGLIARKIVATFNSTGTAAIYLHPTDALHGDLGMVRKDDVVIVISKSGNTEELVDLMPMLRRIDVIIISMIGNRKSKIGEQSDIILNVGVEEEAGPFDLAPTSSTTAALVMGDALAVTLLEYRGFTPEDFAQLHPGGSLGKRLSLKISEIMVKGEDVPKVHLNTTLKDTILEITSKRLGATGVVDDSGKLVGIVTDGDLRRLLEKSMEIKNYTAADVMSENPKTIESHYLASFALQQMESFKITSLIVVDDNKIPIGLVHLHDLVKLGLQRR